VAFVHLRSEDGGLVLRVEISDLYARMIALVGFFAPTHLEKKPHHAAMLTSKLVLMLEDAFFDQQAAYSAWVSHKTKWPTSPVHLVIGGLEPFHGQDRLGAGCGGDGGAGAWPGGGGGGGGFGSGSGGEGGGGCAF
jgi:uncharacterized membrane protein YgcG